ncbi:MAG: oligosaccharide flippase family protein [Brevinematales bacterium]|nr:oligosaccharide flippase family protein [Brevinematales bacterium]
MKALNRQQIIGYTSLMTFATFLTGGINFVFNMVVGRLIGPEEYGILSPLMGSFFSLLSLPVMGLQLFMNQSLGEVSTHHPEGIRSFIRFLFVNLVKLLVVLEMLLWILLPLWQRWLRLPNPALVMILFFTVLLNYLQIFGYTLLQFRHEFGILFWMTILSTLAKLLLGIGMGWWCRTALAVMYAYLLPLLITTVVYTFFLWKWYKDLPNEGFSPPNHFWQALVVSMLSGGAYVALSSFDVLLVRFFFSDQKAVGTYAMAGLIARASFFVASAFTTVFLPVMAKQKEKSPSLTFWGLGILFGILVGYTGGIWIFRSFIAYTLLGGVYPRLENVLVMYTCSFLPYALISFLVSFYTVRQSFFYSATILFGIILQGVLFSLWHKEIYQALIIVGGVGYGLLVILMGEILIQRGKS